MAWVNTGTADVTIVAADQDEFREKLMGEARENWFLPSLVGLLHEQGETCARRVLYLRNLSDLCRGQVRAREFQLGSRR